MQKLRVNTNPAYDVLIGSSLLPESAMHVLSALGKSPSQVLVVSSPKVFKLYGKALTKSLKASKVKNSTILVSDGERNKTLRTVEQIETGFAKAGADRNSCVIALGGGVIGDMAGFAAASFMRGIPVVQLPTTLLAQVDAAIGGKTGVNLPAGKNLVGAFHQPRLVMCDSDLIKTLPQREYIAGLYEVLKCGFIRDAELLSMLEHNRDAILARDPSLVETITTAAVRVKAQVVSADEKEGDLRRILNFGHTIGHALEAATAYKLYLHGEAVALGMLCAAYIAEAAGIASSQITERIQSAVLAYSKLPKVKVAERDIAKRVLGDKKTVDGVTHFVLVPEIGTTRIVSDIPPKIVSDAVKRMKKTVNSQ